MLTPPPHDDKGQVIPHDHPEILVENWVVRRIAIHWVIDDPKFPEGKRITSEAWQPSSEPNGGMSVDLQSLIETDGLDAREFVTSDQLPASIRMNVGFLRAQAFQVGHDPVKDDPKFPDNPYHCQVWGNFSRARRKALCNASECFVPLAGVSLGRDIDKVLE